MSKVNLNNNIFIEGFDDYNDYVEFTGFKYLASKTVLYHGKISEIPEEIAKECVLFGNNNSLKHLDGYFNYNQNIGLKYPFSIAKESIQSACNQEYCIIYKTK